eukprot:766409-Hanusia_phi.AAC.5
MKSAGSYLRLAMVRRRRGSQGCCIEAPARLGGDLDQRASSLAGAAASFPQMEEEPPPLGAKSVSEFFEKPQSKKKSISFGVMRTLEGEEAEDSMPDEETNKEEEEAEEDLPWKDVHSAQHVLEETRRCHSLSDLENLEAAVWEIEDRFLEVKEMVDEDILALMYEFELERESIDQLRYGTHADLMGLAQSFLDLSNCPSYGVMDCMRKCRKLASDLSEKLQVLLLVSLQVLT